MTKRQTPEWTHAEYVTSPVAEFSDEVLDDETIASRAAMPAEPTKKIRKIRKARVEEEGDDEQPTKRSKAPSRRKENRKHRKTIRQYLAAAIFATADDLDAADDGKALKAWAIARVESLEEALEAALSFRTKGRPVVLRAA